MHECRACHNEAERDRRSKVRELRDRRGMASVLTRLANERDNRRVELLCAAMCRDFGGTAGFVAAWSGYWQRAKLQCGPATVRCMMAFMRLVQYCDEHRPDPSMLTDDELRTCPRITS